MKVFITGATGYIGFNVAKAYRRAGHEVWGLTRSEEKARILCRHEIRPVVGSMQQTDGWEVPAKDCSVLIHAAVDYQTDPFALDKQTVEFLLSLARQGPRPKTLIYTSGVWVYGSTHGALVDETTPLNPPKMVARRPATEELVLSAGELRGLVIRPGCVYGYQGGLTGMWFAAAADEKALMAVGDGGNRWTMVHADDLADAYLRAGESGLSGEVFNVTDRSRWSVGEMLAAVARVSGYAGKITFIPVAEAAKTMGDFAECLALDQHADSRKAVRLLGWQPKHGGFVDGAETYFMSWRAAQERFKG
jgi:nucleoside-diphosphate-sugar epimerase